MNDFADFNRSMKRNSGTRSGGFGGSPLIAASEHLIEFRGICRLYCFQFVRIRALLGRLRQENVITGLNTDEGGLSLVSHHHAFEEMVHVSSS